MHCRYTSPINLRHVADCYDPMETRLKLNIKETENWIIKHFFIIKTKRYMFQNSVLFNTKFSCFLVLWGVLCTTTAFTWLISNRIPLFKRRSVSNWSSARQCNPLFMLFLDAIVHGNKISSHQSFYVAICFLKKIAKLKMKFSSENNVRFMQSGDGSDTFSYETTFRAEWFPSANAIHSVSHDVSLGVSYCTTHS